LVLSQQPIEDDDATAALDHAAQACHQILLKSHRYWKDLLKISPLERGLGLPEITNIEIAIDNIQSLIQAQGKRKKGWIRVLSIGDSMLQKSKALKQFFHSELQALQEDLLCIKKDSQRVSLLEKEFSQLWLLAREKHPIYKEALWFMACHPKIKLRSQMRHNFKNWMINIQHLRFVI
jgi:hypothetical protein